MIIEAKVIADSISEAGERLTTFQLKYPRFIHSEMLTHRVFSRNASSSRAIPVRKMIDMVRTETAMPIHWGQNQPGMQADHEIQHVGHAKDLWLRAARRAADTAEEMMKIGLHKQVANRILEPFQHISVVLTATNFDNWFELRAHEDAQPEIHELAIQMRNALSASDPVTLKHGEWHLPYITPEDMHAIEQSLASVPLPEGCQYTTAVWNRAASVSAAKCCRVSYLKHDGNKASIKEELELCDFLVGSRPLHASPFEHQATPDVLVPGDRGKLARWQQPELHGNFTGWIQHRKLIERSTWSV